MCVCVFTDITPVCVVQNQTEVILCWKSLTYEGSCDCICVAALLSNDEEDVVVEPAPLFPSCRFVLSIIGFFMFFHLYAQRVGMSVAIVSMVNQTAVRQMAADRDARNNVTSLNISSPAQCSAQEFSGNSTRKVD